MYKHLFKFKAPLLIFISSLVLFSLLIPENHSEAEDTYYYAQMVEEGAWSEMFHGHHLLYLPLARTIYRGVEILGYTGRSLNVLVGISIVSAAFSVCLLLVILNSRSKWPFVAGMLFSYGFWRYGMAGEIYAPVIALSLGALFSAQRGRFWWSVVFSVSALLLHLVSLPAVMMAIPLSYVLKRQYRKAGIHCAAISLMVASIYALVAVGAGFTLFPDEMVMRTTLLEPLTWVKGIFAFGQSMVSGNFLFSLPTVAGQLEEIFPFHMLQEELFMGSQAPAWIRWFTPVTFTFCLIALTILVVATFIRRPLCSPLGWAGLAWLIGSGAMAMWFEPANPEMWIFAIPAVWLLLGELWETNALRWLPLAAVGILAIHNFAGGLLLVRNGDADYSQQKSEWIMDHAAVGDVILVADSQSFTTYLQYWSSAQVIDMKFTSLDQLFRILEGHEDGTVLVYGDVINLQPAVARRDPDSVAQLRSVGEALRPGLVSIYEDGFGRIYEWRSHE